MNFTTEIIDIIDETHDVKTFKLKKPADLEFVPGQYCLVSLEGKGSLFSESRPFTFSSSPTDKDFFTLTIKKMGDFTDDIFSLGVGDRLKIEGPKGMSLNLEESAKDIVYIAGGSGITPFMSHLRYASAKKLSNRMTLIYTNKTCEDIIYREELKKIVYGNKNIKVVNTITTDTCPGEVEEHGRITKDMIEKHVDSPKEKLYYLCGPPPMIESMKKILKDMGVASDSIRFEDWQMPGSGG